MKLTRSLCLVTVTLAGAFAISAWGQSIATLSGTVSDPSGAAVPNAKVTVHSLATGLDRVIETDGAGLYVAPSLQPGDYKVSVTAAGFCTDTVEKVTLDCRYADYGQSEALDRLGWGDRTGGERGLSD